MISTAIQQLVNYGLDTGLILPDDEIYIRNQLLMTMQLDDFTAPEGEVCYTDLESILHHWWVPFARSCAGQLHRRDCLQTHKAHGAY